MAKVKRKGVGRMGLHLCILQTSFAKREDTIEYLEKKVPGLRISFITDSSLLIDVREKGSPDEAVYARMTMYAMAAEKMGADMILNTCSTVGEVADSFKNVVKIPVLKIDEPMAHLAVEKGEKIALVASLKTTLPPSRRMIERIGLQQGKTMQVEEFVNQDAWQALCEGDTARHNSILLDYIREIDKMGFDAIVMAQVSMRALLPDLEGVKTPILCSFYSGLDAVAEKLNEMAKF